MNILRTKSFDFATKTLKITHQLKELREFHLASQLLKSGTSIGANIEEAFAAQSKKDFISKLGIAYKEMRETEYWFRLIKQSLQKPLTDFHEADIILTEVAKLLTSTLKTSKANYAKNKN